MKYPGKLYFYIFPITLFCMVGCSGDADGAMHEFLASQAILGHDFSPTYRNSREAYGDRETPFILERRDSFISFIFHMPQIAKRKSAIEASGQRAVVIDYFYPDTIGYDRYFKQFGIDNDLRFIPEYTFHGYPAVDSLIYMDFANDEHVLLKYGEQSFDVEL